MRHIIAALLATVLLSGCYYVHLTVYMDNGTMRVDSNTITGGPKDYKPVVDIPVSVIPK